MFWCFIPYNKSFIDQNCSVKMAGYWPRSFLKGTSTSSRSINTHWNLANIQPSWLHAWSITHISFAMRVFHSIHLLGDFEKESLHHFLKTVKAPWMLLIYKFSLCSAHFCSSGEFHVFDPPVPGSARVSTPNLRQLNDTDAASRKFTLDFTGTPGISKRLGQKGNNKD